MASETAERDRNHKTALLIHNSDGTETRQVRSTSNNPNALPVEVVSSAVPTTSSIGDGLKLVTTAGTRETLASSTACKSVAITAKQTNTGTVVVGGSSVVAASGATRRGTPLDAGDTITLEIDNLSKVYVDVTVNGEGVTYTYTV